LEPSRSLIQTDGSQPQHTAHPSDADGAPRPRSPRRATSPNQDRDTGLARRGGTSKQHNPALQCSTRTKKSSTQASVLPPPVHTNYRDVHIPGARSGRAKAQASYARLASDPARLTAGTRSAPVGLALPSILRHVTHERFVARARVYRLHYSFPDPSSSSH
jgi:hypothetical protein